MCILEINKAVLLFLLNTNTIYIFYFFLNQTNPNYGPIKILDSTQGDKFIILTSKTRLRVNLLSLDASKRDKHNGLFWRQEQQFIYCKNSLIYSLTTGGRDIHISFLFIRAFCCLTAISLSLFHSHECEYTSISLFDYFNSRQL